MLRLEVRNVRLTLTTYLTDMSYFLLFLNASFLFLKKLWRFVAPVRQTQECSPNERRAINRHVKSSTPIKLCEFNHDQRDAAASDIVILKMKTTNFLLISK